MSPSGILLISSYAQSPRLRFVVDTVFTLWSGIPVQYLTKPPVAPPPGHVSLLYEPGRINWLTTPFGEHFELSALDPLGKIFYGLSLWERYLQVPVDRHGRPQEAFLPTVISGWHQTPFIHEALAEWVHDLLPASTFFRFEITVDVDQVFRFRGKPAMITFLGLMRDLLKFRFREISDRIMVLSGHSDPYEQTWSRILKNTQHPVKVFFLQGENPRLDSRFRFSAQAYSRQIQSLLGLGAIPGIHPSYASSEDVGLLGQQKRALETVIGTEVRISRQHFLKFTLPETFQELEVLGIKEEHSIAYYSQPGFACGTTLPFYWYNLKEERLTSMMIYPSVVMDRTLCQYFKGTSTEKAAIARHVRDICRANGIPFRVILHHEAFAGRDEWQGLDEMMAVLTGEKS